MSNDPSRQLPAADHRDAASTRGRRPTRRIVVWVWALAAALSIAVLIIAVVGRDRGDGPTLQAMAANEAMSDEQARAVADSTVRVWVRERNSGHLANVLALTCPKDAVGTVVEEVNALKNHETSRIPINIASTGGFARHGSAWTLNTHFVSGVSFEFVLVVQGGELRVCRIASAPIP